MDLFNYECKGCDAGIAINTIDAELIKNKFVVIPNDIDTYEEYRFEEYDIFSNNNKSLENSKKLEFSDVDIPHNLNNDFNKIQQIPTLAITLT